MFAYFVERKEALFNTECRLKLLLNSIKKQCNCELQGEQMETGVELLLKSLQVRSGIIPKVFTEILT